MKWGIYSDEIALMPFNGHRKNEQKNHSVCANVSHLIINQIAEFLSARSVIALLSSYAWRSARMLYDTYEQWRYGSIDTYNAANDEHSPVPGNIF